MLIGRGGATDLAAHAVGYSFMPWVGGGLPGSLGGAFFCALSDCITLGHRFFLSCECSSFFPFFHRYCATCDTRV